MAHYVPHYSVSVIPEPGVPPTDTHNSRFLLSTHYTHYDPWLFTMNLIALVALLVPRLPQVIIAFAEKNASADLRF